MSDNFYKKYLKYKKKYLQLHKMQMGGGLQDLYENGLISFFDFNFDRIVNCLMNFNEMLLVNYMQEKKDLVFLIMKGGGSVIHHVDKTRNIYDLTEDCDLTIVLEDTVNKMDILREVFSKFLSSLSACFPEYKIAYTSDRKLNKITIDNERVIDVSYHILGDTIIEENSMVDYAAKQLNFYSFDNYLMNRNLAIKQYLHTHEDDMELNKKFIEIVSFTEPIFEYYNTVDGMRIFKEHIENFDKKKEFYEKNKNVLQLDALKTQVTNEYKTMLMNKYNRYVKKRALLEQIIAGKK